MRKIRVTEERIIAVRKGYAAGLPMSVLRREYGFSSPPPMVIPFLGAGQMSYKDKSPICTEIRKKF